MKHYLYYEHYVNRSNEFNAYGLGSSCFLKPITGHCMIVYEIIQATSIQLEQFKLLPLLRT